MKIMLIRRKAGSRKDIGKTAYEIPEVKNLRELLLYITEIEYRRQFESEPKAFLTQKEIKQQETQGKIIFGNRYDTRRISLDQAYQTVLQDFADGLFRVFICQEEVSDLDDELNLKENDEIVFLKLVMLAGRLW